MTYEISGVSWPQWGNLAEVSIKPTRLVTASQVPVNCKQNWQELKTIPPSAFGCITYLCRKDTCLMFSCPVVCTGLYVKPCVWLIASEAVPWQPLQPWQCQGAGCGSQSGWRDGG